MHDLHHNNKRETLDSKSEEVAETWNWSDQVTKITDLH